jgi:hypothetical protein
MRTQIWLLTLFVCFAFFAGCENPELSPPPAEPGAPEPPETVTRTILVDFQSATEDIVAEGFAGAGLAPVPSNGQLDSDSWSILGFSDGDLGFGDEADTGDAARGTSDGAVSTGGLYAFEVEPSNMALGVQPTTGDFTPGSLVLRVGLPAGEVVELGLEYRLWVRNDEDRATDWTVETSADGETWETVAALGASSPATADAEPAWLAQDRAATLAPAGETGFLFIRWTATDGDGSGGRDESAVDDIRLEISYRPSGA